MTTNGSNKNDYNNLEKKAFLQKKKNNVAQFLTH